MLNCDIQVKMMKETRLFTDFHSWNSSETTVKALKTYNFKVTRIGEGQMIATNIWKLKSRWIRNQSISRLQKKLHPKPAAGKPQCSLICITVQGSVNKVWLEHSHAHSFSYCLWLLWWYSCRSEQLWFDSRAAVRSTKPKIFTMWLFREDVCWSLP